MGLPSLRIGILTSIAGVSFDDRIDRRDTVTVGEIQIPVISLADIKANKKATGRSRDLTDAEYLPWLRQRARSRPTTR